MNAPTTLLVAAVLVAGGLLAYDAMAARDVARSPSPTTPEAVAMRSDASALERLDARLGALERRLVAQRREIAALRGGSPGSSAPEDASGRKAAAFLEPPPRTPGGDLAIARGTLDELQAYVAEAQRRIRADHQRTLVEQSIDRLDLSLHEDERVRIRDAVLAYREETRTFWMDMRERGITDRQQQIAELHKLRDGLADAIRPYVKDGDLDRVVDALIGRGTRTPSEPLRQGPR